MKPQSSEFTVQSSKSHSVEGVVREILPRALYRIAIDRGREVIAHAASGTNRNFVRLVVGDRVKVELSPRDLGRGRIVRKVTDN